MMSGNNLTGMSEGKPFPIRQCNDDGNAKRFVDRFSDQVRYIYGAGFLVWDGKRWIPDKQGRVMQLARRTAEGIYEEASQEGLDKTDQERVRKWADKSLNVGRLDAMIDLVKSDERIAVRPEIFDRNENLLNVQNGVVDLENGSLLRHEPMLFMSKLVPVIYKPDADCPSWLSFLRDVTGGDDSLIGYLQRCIGYSLTGSQQEQVFFFLYGPGNNGKTTFLKVIQELFGDYAISASSKTFLLKRGDSGHSEDVARLKGARMVIASEMEQGRPLNEALIKDITGGDTVAARKLYQETMEFRPVCKLWMQGNYKPGISGVDDGIWRRVRIIPFEYRVPDERKDDRLFEKLVNELPGILTWAVQGCLEWQKTGLQAPEEVRNITGRYRDSNDPISAFISEELVRESSAKQPAKPLYDHYEKWCRKNEQQAVTLVRFKDILEMKGFTQKRASDGRYWEGIHIRQ